MLWDLNRRGFVRMLPAEGTVDVSDSSIFRTLFARV